MLSKSLFVMREISTNSEKWYCYVTPLILQSTFNQLLNCSKWQKSVLHKNVKQEIYDNFNISKCTLMITKFQFYTHSYITIYLLSPTNSMRHRKSATFLSDFIIPHKFYLFINLRLKTRSFIHSFHRSHFVEFPNKWVINHTLKYLDTWK